MQFWNPLPLHKMKKQEEMAKKGKPSQDMGQRRLIRNTCFEQAKS